MYLIGHLRSRGGSKVLSLSRTNEENSLEKIKDKSTISEQIPLPFLDDNNATVEMAQSEVSPECVGGFGEQKSNGGTQFYQQDRVYDGNKVATSLSNQLPFMYDDYNSKFRDDHITGTLTHNTGSKTFRNGQKVCIPVLTPDRLEKRQNGRRFKEDGDPSFTLTAQDKHGVAVGIDDLYTNRDVRFYDEEVPTLRGERSGVKVGIEVDNKIDIEGNYMPSGHEAGNIMNPKGISAIVAIDADEPDKEHPGLYIQLTEDCLVYAVWYEKYHCYIAIRKLTPKECFRLQGWSDEYFERAEFVNTDSQLYKQAGNGVTVNVVQVVGQKINSAMGIE